jgi:hypothetical protein
MKGSHLFWLSRSKGMLLTFGLGIIILQGVSRRKSLAGVNIMHVHVHVGTSENGAAACK